MNQLVYFLFLLLTATSLHASEFDLPEGYEPVSLEDIKTSCTKALFHIKDASDSNHAMTTLESGPSAIVANCVNAITGDFFETNLAMSIPGAHPMVAQCSYCSSENKWNFLHMPGLQVGYSNGHNHLYARYLDDSGSGMTFRAYVKEKNPYGLSSNQLSIPETLFSKGLTNCGSGEISGQTNWRNSYVTPVMDKRSKKKSYLFRHGSKVDRIFERYKGHSGDSEVPIGKFRLTTEIHPNGNKLCYQYQKNELQWIKVLNNAGQQIGALTLKEEQFSKKWEGGNQWAIFSFSFEDKKLINSVSPSRGIGVTYRYNNNNHLLERKVMPEGRFLKINYYESGEWKGRVKTIETPLGISHKFVYHPSKDSGIASTDVNDAHGNNTEYKYSNYSKRLQSISRWDDINKRVIKDNFIWSRDPTLTGNLAGRSFEEDGKIIFYRALDYDDFENVKSNKLYGNITGKYLNPVDVQALDAAEVYEKTYRYSHDKFNLLLEENDGRKTTTYAYYPNTNLLKERLTKDGDLILKREFFTYDKNGVLTEEIWDDGQSTDKDDLTHVTERHKKVTTTRTANPIGLPEIVEEFYLDLPSNKYVLLKKVVIDYSIFGKPVQEDHYDSNGDLSYSLTWEYDRCDNVIKKTDAIGQTTLYNYDENGNKILEKGPRPGWYKTFEYDLCNRLSVEKEYWSDGTLLVTTLGYNALNQKIKTTDPHGNDTIYTYDSLGNLIKTEGPKLCVSPDQFIQPFEETNYDSLGNPVFQKDANGKITKAAYTITGKPYRIEYPDGTVEEKEYSLDGLLIKEVSKTGLVTEYTHDVFGRIRKTTIYDSSGNILKKTTATYSTFQLLSESDEMGLVTTYEYDGAGRRISMKKGDRLTEYVYDSLGRIFKTIDSIDENQCHVTRKTYDFLGQVREECCEDGNGTLFKKEQYDYDADGNKTAITIFGQAGSSTTKKEYYSKDKLASITDELGNTTRFTYDYHHSHRDQHVLKITKTDPSGNQEIQIQDTHGNTCCKMQLDPFGSILQSESLFYDALGNKTLSQMTVYPSQRLIETEFEYDSMGRIKRSVEAKGAPEQKIVQYHYNDYGQKYKTDLPNGFSLICEYDALGRLATYKSTDNTIHYQYNYDKKDNLTCAKDLIHQTETMRSYDEHYRLKSERLDHGFTLNYEYDRSDRLTSITLPDSSSIRYHYNAHHLNQVERIKNGVIAYSHIYDDYDLAGNVLKETFLGQAGSIIYQYDILQRPIGLHAPHWQETVPADGYDVLSNLLKREVIDDQGSLFYTYAYDRLNQLISEKGFRDHSYENDSIYNRIAKDEQPYDVNSLNQLLSQTQSSYRYDNNGNLVEKITEGASVRYVYDALDRLVEVHHGSDITTYTYDSFHRRLTKTHNGITTSYLYHDQNEIGAIVNGNIFQLRLLGLTRGAEIGAAVAFELDEKVYAPIHDPQGNVVALLDSAGNCVENYRYTAFGESETYSKSNLNNPWRFSSKRYDAETSFHYFGRRYYAADIGRWTTADPAGYADGPNLYAYVHNHPLAHIDPDGRLVWFLLPFAVSMAIDYALPAAVAFAEPYTGVAAASFLSGVVKGLNNSFELNPMSDPVTEGTGMALGTILSLRPSKLIQNGLKACTNLVKNEVAEHTTKHVTAKFTKAFQWFKSTGTSQATQKTTHVAEKLLKTQQKNITVATREVADAAKATRHRFVPDINASGAHTVFRRDPVTSRISHYETFIPQTNLKNPNPWQTLKRYDGPGCEGHWNKTLQKYVKSPHVHDTKYPGKIRRANLNEMPNLKDYY